MQPEDVINHYEEKVAGATPDSVLRDEVQTLNAIANVAPLQKLLPQIKRAYGYVRECITGGRKKNHANSMLPLVVSGLAYLALPNDIVPDFIPAVGWLDDIIVLEWIFRQLGADFVTPTKSDKSSSKA